MTAKIHIYSDICKEIEEKVIDEGFFYLTRPLLLGDFRKSSPVPFFTLKEGAPPLSPKSPLATPKSFTLGNDQMHLSLLSLNQDFPLRVQGT